MTRAAAVKKILKYGGQSVPDQILGTRQEKRYYVKGFAKTFA
jgi:hypothetical protein